MSRSIPLLAFVFALVAGLPSLASAQAGPDMRSGYVSISGDLLRNLSGTGTDGPTGGSVDWGAFQNRYISAGTKIGLWNNGPRTELPRQLFFGGGAQFHIPIGAHVVIMPAVNLGIVLLDSAFGSAGFGVYASLAVAYKWNRFYFGLQAERPIYLPTLPDASSDFFPALTTAGLIVGIYY